jgi:hypothetical protein
MIDLRKQRRQALLAFRSARDFLSLSSADLDRQYANVGCLQRQKETLCKARRCVRFVPMP